MFGWRVSPVLEARQHIDCCISTQICQRVALDPLRIFNQTRHIEIMRMCFFGDSFVNGTGDDDGLGWPGRVVASTRRRGFDVTYYNLGVRRDTSEDVLARWLDEAARRLPAGCVARLAFSFGTNDCTPTEQGGARLPLETSIVNASRILSKAVSIAPTLMIGPPPVLDDLETDERVRRLSNALGELCKQLAVPFLETFSFVSACEPWRREAAAGDGTHPNSGGYSALAGFFQSWPAWNAWLDSSESGSGA